MHGGIREGSGRKVLENKKKAVTIYLDEKDIEMVEKAPLP